ncbi:MAG: AAA family ATPase, partial [Candidatus Omnitrophica bacterium]|nr:AAA family ATPase [Candidatus Omnitrophota bacterium]
NFFVIDLIARLKCRPLLVSRSGLGTINHSLLSAEALSRRRIRPVGIVFNRLKGGAFSLAEKTNPSVVSGLSGIPSLGVFPYVSFGKRKVNFDQLGRLFLKHIDLEKILC